MDHRYLETGTPMPVRVQKVQKGQLPCMIDGQKPAYLVSGGVNVNEATATS